MFANGQELNVTNNGRRSITLPQLNGRAVKIPARGTARVHVFAPNSGKIRRWVSTRMISLAPYVAPTGP